jgi:serine phosphatase RsbU (regulator of sigma subunit)/tetratricopeptide (TPR) repeat protein
MNSMMWKRVSLFLLVFSLLSIAVPAQKAYTDSLEKVLEMTKDPLARLSLLNELGGVYLKTKPERAYECAKQALELAQKAGKKGAEAGAYTSIGNYHYLEGNYTESLKNYLAAGKIMEALQEKKGIAGSYTGIANVYYAQNDIAKALEYHQKALAIWEELKSKQGLSGSLMNIANIYQLQKKLDLALDYNYQALQMKQELGDYKGLSSSYNNIGNILYEQGHYDSALNYQLKAMQVRQKLNNKAGLAGSYINIGNIYDKQGKVTEAIDYQQKAVELAKGIGYKDALKSAYLSLAALHEKQKSSDKALEYYKLYTDVKDTLLNEEKSKQLATLQTVYETEKKEKEIVLLTKERQIQDLVLNQQQQQIEKQAFENEKKRTQIELLNKQKQIQELDLEKKEGELTKQKLLTEAQEREAKLQQANAERQKLVSLFTGLGLVMMILLAFFIFRSYRQKKKSNIELADKNEKIQQAYVIIEQNRDEIAQKNKDIQDSINYAKRIQEAILPPVDAIKKAFPESFILYQPRDVVSGDFYSFAEKNGKTVLAAVDCTGHGVPGALMSMIGNDQLNQIVAESGITKPSEVLSRLNKGIKNALKQNHDDSETKDGMDIAICTFDLKNNVVEYAGAQRPLWYISNGVLNEIKGNDVSVGGITRDDFEFTNHTIGYTQGDMFYLFSDGYIDQFGGVSGKKFMNKRFKELLMDIHPKPMDAQRSMLVNNFSEWKQDLMQVDDVLVVGVRV